MDDAGGALQVSALAWFIYDGLVHVRRDVDTTMVLWRSQPALLILYLVTRLLALALLVGQVVTHNWSCAMFDTDRAGAVPHPVTIAGTVLLAMLGHGILGLSVLRLTNEQIHRRIIGVLYAISVIVSAVVAGVVSSYRASHRPSFKQDACEASVRMVSSASPVYGDLLAPWCLFGFAATVVMYRVWYRPTLVECRRVSTADVARVTSFPLVSLAGVLITLLPTGVRMPSVALVHAAIPLASSRLVWNLSSVLNARARDPERTHSLQMLPQRHSNSHDYELGCAKPDPDEINLDSPGRKHVSITLPKLSAAQVNPDHQLTTGATATGGHRRLASDSEEGDGEYIGMPTRTARRSVSFSRLTQVFPHPTRTDSPVPSITLDNTPGNSPYPSHPSTGRRRAPESAIAHRLSQAELDFDMEFDDGREEATGRTSTGAASFLGIASGASMKEMSSDDVSGLVMVGGGHGRGRLPRDSNVSWEEESEHVSSTIHDRTRR